MAKRTVHPHRGMVAGGVRIPPSKYHLHRALIFGSLAEGETVIHGRSEARHIHDTLRSLRDYGIAVRHTENGYVVNGGPYRPRSGKIRVGSSGSTLQFMLGLGSLAQGRTPVYDGHKALRERPIGPLLRALGDLGIRWEASGSKLPVTIYPGVVQGGRVQIPGTLSQWISGLLILAPFAKQDTVIEALPPCNELTYVRLTIEMLRQFGIRVEEFPGGTQWRVPAGQTYRAAEIRIEPDLSSAAFPLVLSALFPADVVLQGIAGTGTHPENKILELMENFGLPLSYTGKYDGLRVRHAGKRPASDLEIDMRHIPDLIPALSVLAAVSQGTTVLKNIGPGRLKESDRVKAMRQLNRMGARVEELGDDLVIEGVERLRGASISTFNDHRVQMAFTLAALKAETPSELTFPNAYKISYPEFFDHLEALGVQAYAETLQTEEAVRA
ncbi:3-phosphoshikimate 1-carboxyvinyltransferase [Cohnella caldifontis]|uniref:3-phosphoshikimate 1-carboxyvinyltransferase n=1 Tax=Cohnella caldifontis TaxID=3027471 RepID=UPI0023EBBF37|nr:3-phosphoshikimate 1-carboxyvinyltransferase [Cohnella sp. YIM B05605]